MKAPLFKQVAGANNPLNKVGANTLTIPYFIDINADGDYDCFIGEGTTGAIIYYRNTGSATHPQFEKQSAANNPLSMVKFGKELKPGAYFVQVFQNDKAIYTKKIIKE